MSQVLSILIEGNCSKAVLKPIRNLELGKEKLVTWITDALILSKAIWSIDTHCHLDLGKERSS